MTGLEYSTMDSRNGSELNHLTGPTGLDDLKTLAISRLMCDNIPHIKSFWIMHSPKLAQIALNWGVDDLDGTVVWYDITKREGDGTTITCTQLKRISTSSGNCGSRSKSTRPPSTTTSAAKKSSSSTTGFQIFFNAFDGSSKSIFACVELVKICRSLFFTGHFV